MTNHYENDADDTCLACVAPCLDCDSSSNCLSCDGPNKTAPECDCDDGYYLIDGICA